ncbi:putative bifunctional diguanylate cyclase/phosphodiesterase [Sulfurimonas marina]|uniref:EAL domain-containing protein n=1 Tax=Sulfurimonas marina TaxID=2590551 RepID=A0A7M1AUM1_9BACT|nr:GGDEF and EAL domain-containing protein [Sulfurimonas marina]QOP41141.1 EAL domain-containing protein [Sulfurimonas marina]
MLYCIAKITIKMVKKMSLKYFFKRFYFSRTQAPLLVTLGYTLTAVLWILGSSQLLSHIEDPKLIHQIEKFKGLAFVFITSGLLYVLLRSWYKRIMASHDQLKATLDTIPDLLFEVDLDGRYFDYHSSRDDLLAAPADKLIGKTIHEILPKDAADVCIEALYEANVSGSSHGKQIELLLGEEHKWFELSVARKIDLHSTKPHFIVLSRDITERKLTEEQLLKLSQAIEQNTSALMITDVQGTIEYVNAAFTRITGYTPQEAVGQNPQFLGLFKTPTNLYNDLWNHLIKGEQWSGEFINRKKNGEEYFQSIVATPIIDKNGNITNYMAVGEDITNRKKSEEQIHFLANFDPLTGLPNRVQMEDRFNYIISISRRNEHPFALMFLDLDHFKDINDSLGHKVGDELLINLSQRLKSILREEDTISRLGGDEFVLVLPDTDAHAATVIAQKLLESIHQTIVLSEYELSVTFSIGIALYPSDGNSLEVLLKNADAAMYRAKIEGRNSYRFFTEEMQQQSMRTLELSNALHHAIQNNELHLVYQPQISANSSTIIGAEALLRWNHPIFGNVSPSEFIAIAEDNGLILQIGEWVLRNAIAQTKLWIDKGLPPIIMAINLSAVQFRDTALPELIASILQEIQLPPEYLEIELTERAAMHDPEKAIVTMNKLHNQGIRMSIDDFGTGYSSLSYLKKFNIYKLKIDQSFIRDINTDAEDKAIVGAIIDMAKGLDLLTIAEGVETVSQLKFLKNQGCDEIQGYLFSKPLIPSEFESFVAERFNGSTLVS